MKEKKTLDLTKEKRKVTKNSEGKIKKKTKHEQNRTQTHGVCEISKEMKFIKKLFKNTSNFADRMKIANK